MNKTSIKQLFFVGLCILAQYTHTTTNNSLFIDRPFGADIARELILEQNAWTKQCHGWFGTLQVAGQYTQSWESNSSTGLGAYPFWSGNNTMTVGSNLSPTPIGGGPLQAPDVLYDVDAYQFGLGPVTEHDTITLNPIISHAGVDILFFIGAHEDEPGIFLKVNAPIGTTIINPRLTETNPDFSVPYPGGAFNLQYNPDDILPLDPTPAPYANMVQAFAGDAASGKFISYQKNQDDPISYTPVTSIGIYYGLVYGKINGKINSGTQFGDIDIALGYNFLASETSHAALLLRGTIPTSKAPTAEYIFEPIFGNGSHWGLGAEFFAHHTFYEENEHCLQFWVDVYATHLFKSKQTRSFDLTANGPGSRYLLTSGFATNGDSMYQVQPLINLSSLVVASSFNYFTDGALSLRYEHTNWNAQIGYNFTGRGSEKLIVINAMPEDSYAVIGRQINADDYGDLTYAVQPNAKINGVLANPILDVNDIAANTVQGIRPTSNLLPDPFALRADENMISGNDALNITDQQLAAAWTSKLFINGGYIHHESDYAPSIGLFGSAQFSHSQNNATNAWSIGLTGGFSF
ncbi:hypothetical protein EBQ93_03010 [bacterium]|nr:hypothetical protein [bacterium]